MKQLFIIVLTTSVLAGCLADVGTGLDDASLTSGSNLSVSVETTQPLYQWDEAAYVVVTNRSESSDVLWNQCAATIEVYLVDHWLTTEGSACDLVTIESAQVTLSPGESLIMRAPVVLGREQRVVLGISDMMGNQLPKAMRTSNSFQVADQF